MSSVLGWHRGFNGLASRNNSLASDLLFFVPLGIWMLARITLGYSSLYEVLSPVVSHSVVCGACMAVLLVREILFGKWDRWVFLGACALGFVAYMSTLGGLAASAAETAVFIFAGRDMPFRKIAVFCLFGLIVVVGIVLASVALGVIPNLVLMRGETPRYHLGFNHPNCAGAFFLSIISLWVYLRGRRFTLVEALAAVCLILVVNHFIDSRTSLLLMLAIVALGVVGRFVPASWRESRVVKVGFTLFPLACILASIVMAIVFDPNVAWMSVLDSKLSGRLNLAHSAIANFGVGLLPNNVNMTDSYRWNFVTGEWMHVNTGGIVVDCVYVKMLIKCGVLHILVVCALCTAGCKQVSENRNWIAMGPIVIFALLGLSEVYAIYAFFNPFLFLMGSLFKADRGTAPPAPAMQRETSAKRGKHAK